MSVLPGDVIQGRRNPRHLALGERLKRLRKESGRSYAEIAGVSGVADRGIAYLEQGRKAPLIDTVEKIARGLEVSPCWLAFGLDVPIVPDDELRSTGVGSRLRQVRESMGMSRKSLGKLADLSTTAISNIEDKGHMPSVATVETLAKALGIDVCWLSYQQGTAPELPPGQAKDPVRI